ncbi:HNH endonuclease signature motif containing protein [Nocardia heshunensis]
MTDIADEMATAQAVVAQLRDVHSQIAALQAEEVALMTALYHLRREQQLDLGVSNLNAGEDTATEIGIALKVSQGTADGLIGLGLDLENRCTATRDAFAAGRIDLAQTRAITKSLSNASDELLAELEPSLAAYAEKAEPQRIRRTARRRLLEADPAGQAARRKAAEADRYVSITAHDDGTALLDGVLPAAGGQTLYERLREMASTQCCGKDPRTVAQRRADALVALADGTGRLICQCNSADCPRAIVGEVPVPRKALVQVGVSAETLAGLQDNPALLSGLGAIDPALARQIARHARFEIITDTHPATTATTHIATGHAALSTATAAVAETGSAAAGTTSLPATGRHAENTDSATELRYRPGVRTARQARAIDGICRAPGCHIPAAASDLDHQDRFDHNSPQTGGHTTEDNLGARCRRHHRLKTLADNHANGWTVRHHPGRVVEWRTPTGESAITEPEGSQYLFPTTVVPPVTAAGVPDAEPTGSIFDPGVAVNIMTELVQVYTTPGQRRQHARARASRRAGINM